MIKSDSSKHVKSGNLKTKPKPLLSAITIFLIILLVAAYLYFTWQRKQDDASKKAIMLAQSLGSMLNSEQIIELSARPDNIETDEYIMLKENLMQLADKTNPIHFAYLFHEQEGRIKILVDSEPTESPDHSPSDQIYIEADKIFMEPFKTGNTVLTPPITDQWGEWISVLVPIKNPLNGRIIAVFGLNYSAPDWNAIIWVSMFPDIIISIGAILLLLAFLLTQLKNAALKSLSKKLAYNEAIFHSAFDQAPIGVAIVDDFRLVSQSEFDKKSCNIMFLKILGRSSQELSQITWTEITHPDDLPADLEKFDQFKNGTINAYSIEKRFGRPDGTWIWTRMSVSPLVGLPFKHNMHLCLIEDISLRKAAEDSLKESERNKSVLLSNLPGLAYRCNYDHEWTMQFVSDGCFELTGYKPESLLHNRDLSYSDLISPEYRDFIWNEWERLLPLRVPFKREYEIITSNGERKWVIEFAEGVFNENGEVEALEGIVVDISERKALENELVYNNEHDRWTGLFNRVKFENQLNSDSRNNSNQKKALVGINLGATQSITATYGFHYTQDLMKKTADTLSQFCTESHTLYNTYLDRFVFYVKDYADKNELLDFSTSISNTLETLLKDERVSGGLGIIEIDQSKELNADLLLKKLLISTEKAMINLSKNFSACFYDDEMELEKLREEDIKRELSQIAYVKENKSLYLQYQAIYDLKCNRICGFEALARINSDKLGRIPPLDFIPLAEQTKLIIPIGDIIIRQALNFHCLLKEKGYENIDININVSAIQLLNNNFVENLIDTIHEMQVRPENIGLELTESVFAVNYDEINLIIKKLRDFGFQIAIDDFGTGYSSLARERELKVDCLKIDKHFIDKLMEIQPENAITRDIISMAHKMGHCALAEGVEYEKQKQYLLENGCDKIQGYLISRPLDESDAVEFLNKQIITDSGSCSYNHPSGENNFGLDMLPDMSKSELRLILDSTAEAIYGIDINGICTFCNISCINVLGYNKQEDLLGKNMHWQIHHSHRNKTSIPLNECKILMSMREGKGFAADDEVFLKSDGSPIEVEYRSYPQIREGEVTGAVISFLDVTDRKLKEEEIEYLNCHDVLTGLYNRRYFEENLEKIDRSKNWPLSVIFADINGLKMTNDIFGHISGDKLIQKSAEILKKSCREQDLIARVGGDEFIILLPKTSHKMAEKILSRIREGFASARVAAIQCSISIGTDTKIDADQTLEVILANAENLMYQDKTLNRKVINKDIIDTIVETLHTKSIKEKDHSIAVQNLCGEFGEALEMPEPEIAKLQRVGYLHDIGKIVLDEGVLINDELNEVDSEKMRQHPVAGYRILNLFDDTLDLAEYVYNHHEHWDGNGYPRGLKGVQIPLISRILTVLEAYERIINRGDESKETRQKNAIQEILNGAGTQFDPMIAKRFASMMSDINMIYKTKKTEDWP